MSMQHNSELCKFLDIGLDNYQCLRCGKIVTTYDGFAPVLLCDYQRQPTPIENSLACSEDEVSQRYSICETCEFFNNHTCEKCGCAITSAIELHNKLYWKDQHCPINKW